MSRSFRKAIIKEKGKFNSSYNKTIRRVNKSIVKILESNLKSNEHINNEDVDSFLYEIDNLFDLEDKIKHPKEIINSYDISDFKTNFEAFTSKELEKYDLVQDKIKYRRK